jgi:hypothetical protein
MQIGIIDVDGHSGFPNLPLMKISAWHKEQGDEVEMFPFFGHKDKVYLSKVFTFTPDFATEIDADEIIRGGTGYRDYGKMDNKFEAMKPDYSLYPKIDYAVGFLTRGCIRKCDWCVVPQKEGHIRANSTWQTIKRADSKKLVLLDNNVLASDFGISQIEEMGSEDVDVSVDFNQGLDARLITAKIAKKLAALTWIRYIRLSCDTLAMLPAIRKAMKNLEKYGVKPYKIFVYVLVKDIDDAHKRVVALDKMGVAPFAQPFRDIEGTEPSREQKDFARWVNKKQIFHSCSWSEYQRDVRKGKKK